MQIGAVPVSPNQKPWPLILWLHFGSTAANPSVMIGKYQEDDCGFLDLACTGTDVRRPFWDDTMTVCKPVDIPKSTQSENRSCLQDRNARWIVLYIYRQLIDGCLNQLFSTCSQFWNSETAWWHQLQNGSCKSAAKMSWSTRCHGVKLCIMLLVTLQLFRILRKMMFKNIFLHTHK